MPLGAITTVPRGIQICGKYVRIPALPLTPELPSQKSERAGAHQQPGAGLRRGLRWLTAVGGSVPQVQELLRAVRILIVLVDRRDDPHIGEVIAGEVHLCL